MTQALDRIWPYIPGFIKIPLVLFWGIFLLPIYGTVLFVLGLFGAWLPHKFNATRGARTQRLDGLVVSMRIYSATLLFFIVLAIIQRY